MSKAPSPRIFHSASGSNSSSLSTPVPSADGDPSELRAEKSTASASRTLTTGSNSVDPTGQSFMSKLIRLRTGWGWVLGVVALGLAFLGEKLAEDERIAQSGLGVPPLLSWILFGVAAVVFAIGIAPGPSTPASPTPRFFASLRAMSRQCAYIVPCPARPLNCLHRRSSAPVRRSLRHLWTGLARVGLSTQAHGYSLSWRWSPLAWAGLCGSAMSPACHRNRQIRYLLPLRRRHPHHRHYRKRSAAGHLS